MTIERRLRILPDSDACNPRTEFDCHVGRMLCWHSRYNLGDEHSYDSDDWKRELACEADADLEEWIEFMEHDGWEALYDIAIIIGGMDSSDASSYASEKIDAAIDDRVDRAFDAGYVALPLYLYDHSGITMNTGGFSCPWDSGCVGVIVCDNDTIEKEFAGDRDRAEKALRAEVEEYDAYISGEVYYFLAESAEYDEETEELDEVDWIVEDSCGGFYGHDPRTNGMADHLGDEFADCIDNPVYE